MAGAGAKADRRRGGHGKRGEAPRHAGAGGEPDDQTESDDDDCG